MKISKLVIAFLLCVSMFTGCFLTGKTHYGFEKIYGAYFSEQTKFFSTYNLIFVIERDKLVCINPDNGEMLDFVELPGYPIDVCKNIIKNADLSMIFSSGKEFVYRDFIFADKKPYIKVNRTSKVMGSQILNNKESFLGNDYLLIGNSSSNSLFLYSANDIKLLDTLQIKKEFKVSMDYGPSVFLIYDGNQLVTAGVEKGKFVMPLTTGEWKNHHKWTIPATDFNRSFLKSDAAYILLYNGSKLYKMTIMGGVGDFEEMVIPPVESVGGLGGNVVFGCNDGMYYLDIYSKLVKVSDNVYDVIDKSVDQFFGDNYSLAGKLIGKNYHLIGLRKPMFAERKKGEIVLPKIITFDLLPEGTFSVGFARIKNSTYVYAFTSEGLYRSDVLFIEQDK